MSRNLSTQEVSRLLGIPEATIRRIVRAGWCGPVGRGRRYAFRFEDLVVLRAARDLLSHRVPEARIRRALATLTAELPAGRPLSGVRIWADGQHVAVCDGGSAWQPETGQCLFAFDLDPLAAAVEGLRQERRSGAPGLEAADEFERALDLQDEDPKAAAEAYERALRGDPELVDAYVNLGRIRHDAGDAAEACALYRQALTRCADDPVIHYNLAIAIEDAEGPESAVPHYERALALDPTFADAHYNLAGLHEQAGRAAAALRHYHAYKRLVDG